MPQTITGLDQYTNTFTTISAGDPAVAAAVRANMQALLNNDVHNNTQIAHQSADDRGGEHTITGSIIWDGSGPSNFQLNLPVVFGGLVRCNGPVAIQSTGNLINLASSSLRGDVLVGSGPSNALSVYATTDMFAPLNLHDDATFGHHVGIGGGIDVSGGADFDTDAQITHSGQMLTVGGGLTVNQDTQFNGTVRSSGSTHWGDSSTDGHLFSGGVSMQQTLDVAGAVTINGVVTFGSSPNDLGSSAIVGDLTTLGSLTIGNNSADTITANAALASPLSFTGAGRVPNRLSLLPNADTSITVSSGNIFYLNNSLTADRTYTLQNTGATDGDFVWFSNASSFSAIVTGSGTTVGRTIPAGSTLTPNWAWWTYKSSFGGWILMAHN